MAHEDVWQTGHCDSDLTFSDIEIEDIIEEIVQQAPDRKTLS